MNAKTSKKKPKGATKPTTEDDASNTVDREALAIESILPKARDHPELYSNTIQRIKKSYLRKTPKWSECSLWRSWRGWLDAAGRETRPSLDFFLACLAAHTAYDTRHKTKFMEEVIDLDLMDWAMGQLQRETLVNKSAAKPLKVKKGNIPEHANNATTVKRSSEYDESVLLSIESPIQHSPRSPDLGTSPSQSTRPLKRKSTAILETQDFNRVLKLSKPSDESHRLMVTTTDAATQTDTEVVNAWVLDHARKLIDPGKGIFVDTMVQQHKTLIASLPGMISQVVRRAVSHELACQQLTRSIQPQVVRPVVTGMQYARPPYQTYPDSMGSRSHISDDALNYRHENIRIVDGRDGGPGVTTVMPAGFDRPLDLSGYRLAPAPEQWRF